MFITCPWCGTNYTEFHSNCKNCGGPLPAPKEFEKMQKPGAKLQFPPQAPREISPKFIRRLLLSDGWAITAIIFLFIGGIFSLTGAGLTIGIITAFVGVPFLVSGLFMLFGGVAVLAWRYQIAEKRVKVLKDGLAAQGEIVDLVQNSSVRVNGRHPWKITYAFELNDEVYEGNISTLNPPGTHLAPGSPAVVLYLEDNPQFNGLYPHP